MTDDEINEHRDEKNIRHEIERLETLKREKLHIEAEIDDIQQYLAKAVDKEFRFDDDENDQQVQATIVRGTIDRFDEHLMSTRYKKIYALVTKRTVDKGLYLDALRAGAITPEMHAKFHHEVPKKSFVKITRYKRGGEDQ